MAAKGELYSFAPDGHINIDGDDDGCCASTKGRRSLCAISFILFVIAVVGLGVVLALHFVEFRKDQYGIVFDGGSSHTDMSLYRWPGDKIEETGVVVEVTKCVAEAKKGISSHKDNPEGAGKSIEACLKEAQMKVPADRKDHTPIYLGATAGMRILRDESATKADAVLASIRKRFEESGFKYESTFVRILDGVEEGIAGWISSNLLLGLLGEDGTKKDTAGTLDMGGASTQITFETSDKGQNPEDGDNQANDLYGHHFPLFAHTYLCFGMNEATRRLQSELVLAAGIQETTVDNPCFNKGYGENKTASYLFGTACTQSPKNVDLSEIYNLVGTGDTNECAKLVANLLNTTTCQNKGYKNCFDLSVIPEVPTNRKFLAISGFYHSADFIKGKNTTVAGFRTNTDKLCNEEWEEVKKRPDFSKYSGGNCFNAHYVYQVLNGMYKFNTDEKWKNLDFSLEIDGVEAGWTLGFMTSATNALPVEAIRGITSTLFIPLVAVFGGLVLVSLIIVVGYRICNRG